MLCKGKKLKNTQEQMKRKPRKRLETYLFLETKLRKGKQLGQTEEKPWYCWRKMGRLKISVGFLSSPVMRAKMARVWLRNVSKDESGR